MTLRQDLVCLRHSIDSLSTVCTLGVVASLINLSAMTKSTHRGAKRRGPGAGSSLRSPTSPGGLAYLLRYPDLHKTRPGPCRNPPPPDVAAFYLVWLCVGPTYRAQLPPLPWTRTSLRSLGLGTTCYLCCVGVRGSGALLKTGISRSYDMWR
jgi:hypothetical protein